MWGSVAWLRISGDGWPICRRSTRGFSVKGKKLHTMWITRALDRPFPLSTMCITFSVLFYFFCLQSVVLFEIQALLLTFSFHISNFNLRTKVSHPTHLAGALLKSFPHKAFTLPTRRSFLGVKSTPNILLLLRLQLST